MVLKRFFCGIEIVCIFVIQNSGNGVPCVKHKEPPAVFYFLRISFVTAYKNLSIFTFPLFVLLAVSATL